ncbi:MAG: AbrB/MazE/SpoVT family DNA-binding domain-containing protein [Nitrospirae bacterium]|nr:AbrB/MazE/SpoVT family DNA-binding domain-containing protein [Nitrospirota bacterium]
MQAVKVLPKGQITLPKEIRESLDIKVGDTLVVEKAEGRVVLKKGKTIFDYVGTLPSLGMSIEEIREKAIEEAVKDRG